MKPNMSTVQWTGCVPRKRGTLSSDGLVHALGDAMPAAVQSPAFRRNSFMEPNMSTARSSACGSA